MAPILLQILKKAQSLPRTSSLHSKHYSLPKTIDSSTINASHFKRYAAYTLGIAIGIPTAIAGTFVYNLKHDDAFYQHFAYRFPELIHFIQRYVELDEKAQSLSSRSDIGPITSASDLENEEMTVSAVLQSGKITQFRVLGSMCPENIEQEAIRQANTSKDDRVISIQFIDDSEGVDTIHKNAIPLPHNAINVSWGSLKNSDKKPSQSAVRDRLESLDHERLALEKSKYTSGRDIDAIDAEIQIIEEKRKELKCLLERKRFIIF